MPRQADLNKWLFSAKAGRSRTGRAARCETCLRFPQLNDDIKDWMKRKRSGQLHLPTFSHVGSKSLLSYLSTKGYDLTGMSLVRHIGLCLGIDHKTGKPH